ncbi:MAG: chemotaxis response regulator protein-glutamate methylesterase [Candidatus Omnitrophota bacterium]|nr:chemotaxis response regulator protein-glutamate methylesterase [Candidatus Omnitrophota bacterium]
MEKGLKGIIRVLVVDDSPLMCKVLTNILNSDPQIIVAGIAHNGKEAVEFVPKLKPDIITMDIHMPQMDGFEATKEIMAYNPTPILIVSTSVFKAGMNKVFKAISFGALDVIDKGQMELCDDKKTGEALLEKIKFLSGIKVIHHPLAKLDKERRVSLLEVHKRNASDRIVAIVASTGGPQALLTILKRFARDFPCGVVVVQHITSGFVEGLADWLDSECQIRVKIAQDSEEIKSGIVYIAPCDLQMRVEEKGKIHLTNEPAYDGHRPSGDVLLESVARIYREDAVGVILTGMGRDGAGGIKVMKEMCGQTIAQDEHSCVVFGMPKVAIEMGVIDKVLPLGKISEEVVRILER